MYTGMSGIWFTDTSHIFLAGPGFRLYENGIWKTQTLPHNGFSQCLRGVALNDLFVAGHAGAIQHFNGKAWKHYPDAVPSGLEITYFYMS